jgi:hypothetical protein
MLREGDRDGCCGKRVGADGVGIGILIEMKVTNNRYSKSLSGYRVLVSKAASPHQGGIGLIWREDHDGFEVKALQPLTPNLMTFQLVMGYERYYIAGIFLPPQLYDGCGQSPSGMGDMPRRLHPSHCQGPQHPF